MIYTTFIKDYNKEFTIKIEGLVIADIIYDKTGKLISVKRRNEKKELLKKVTEFKNYYEITTDDVITIVNMYFANELSLDYTGKSIFKN